MKGNSFEKGLPRQGEHFKGSEVTCGDGERLKGAGSGGSQVRRAAMY